MRPATESIVRKILIGIAACIAAIGVYLSFWWSAQWQAGLCITLFGMVVLVPTAVQEIRFRRGLKSRWDSEAKPR